MVAGYGLDGNPRPGPIFTESCRHRSVHCNQCGHRKLAWTLSGPGCPCNPRHCPSYPCCCHSRFSAFSMIGISCTGQDGSHGLQPWPSSYMFCMKWTSETHALQPYGTWPAWPWRLQCCRLKCIGGWTGLLPPIGRTRQPYRSSAPSPPCCGGSAANPPGRFRRTARPTWPRVSCWSVYRQRA